MLAIRKLSEINEGDTVDFEYQGNPAILIKFKDKLHAYVNVCTHEGGPCILEEVPGVTAPGEAMSDPAPPGSHPQKSN